MRNRSIMIVDEAADHRSILRRLLHATGYRVIEAASSLDALDQARAQQPDLILMALTWPSQASSETARLLRAQPALEHTPILGTTVYNTLLSASRLRSIGCVDYVDKPFDFDHLLWRIDQLLSDALQTVPL